MTDPEQNQKDDLPQLHLDSQLCFPLYAAARKVVNHYTPYLKPLGITYTQYTRSRSRQDERVVAITVTPQGWELRQRVKDIPFRVGGCIPLAHEEAYQLFLLLHKLIQSME